MISRVPFLLLVLMSLAPLGCVYSGGHFYSHEEIIEAGGRWYGDVKPDVPPPRNDALQLPVRDYPDRVKISFIEEGSTGRRLAAIYSLSSAKSDAPILPLIRVLDDASLDVRRLARYTLRQLSGKDFGPDSSKWMDWYEREWKPKRAQEG